MALIVRQFQAANRVVVLCSMGNQLPGAVLAAVIDKQKTGFGVGLCL